MAVGKQHTQTKAAGHEALFGTEESLILGYNVERLRNLAQMDVATFARVAGISRPTVYKIERGEADLKLSYLKKLASALGVTVVDLITPPIDEIDFGTYCRAQQQRPMR